MNQTFCRWFLSLFLVLFMAETSECQSNRPPKRLLLLGQKPDSHPATTHEYMAGVKLLAGLLDRIPECKTIVVQADSPWVDGPELLESTDGVVLFLTEGAKWISDDPNRLSAFKRLAQRGGGLTCLHWGMGTREAGPVEEFSALFGACHGGSDRKYKIVTETIQPTDVDHSIVIGMKPFQVRDEFYYALKLPRADRIQKHTSLLTVPIEGSNESVAWATERRDGGRSFGFSGLHYHENWRVPEYRRLVLQGIAWTIAVPIPPAGLNIDCSDEVYKLPKRTPQK